MENAQNLMPEMSEKYDVVMKQLMLAKKEMGSAVKKDAKNPFHKSSYASLGAHLALCEDTLDRHGLIMLQTVNGSHDKAILISTLCHSESGQWIKSYLPLPNPKNDSQGLGASITYMRRYSINSMLGLSAEDDDGESACVRPKSDPKNNDDKKPAPVDKISGQELYELRQLERGLDKEHKDKINKWLKETHKCEKLEDVTREKFPKVLLGYQHGAKMMEQTQREMAHA